MHPNDQLYAAVDSGSGGALFIVAAPIGNLEDLTFRALRVLKQADLIAAEDTRVARKLLSHCGVRGKKILSLRGANEVRAGAALIAAVRGGKRAAYLADAGTPAVSDPGARLARAAAAAGVALIPIPGASALTCALSVAGLLEATVAFAGFLPRAKEKKEDALAMLAAGGGAAVIFESPARVCQTVADLRRHFGDDARCVVCREMTKMHEQIRAESLSDADAALAAGDIPTRGEFTLVVSPSANRAAILPDAARVFALLRRELPPRRAAALAAALSGERAADLYRRYAVD